MGDFEALQIHVMDLKSHGNKAKKVLELEQFYYSSDMRRESANLDLNFKLSNMDMIVLSLDNSIRQQNLFMPSIINQNLGVIKHELQQVLPGGKKQLYSYSRAFL